MIRRARLSFKPNVRPGGRAPGSAAASGGDGGAVTPQPEPVHESGKENVTGGPEEKPKTAAPGGTLTGNDQEEPSRAGTEPPEKTVPVNDEQTSKASVTPLQRRKRISTLPNLAKPRISNAAPVAAPTPKPPPAEKSSALPASNALDQGEASLPDQAKLPSSPKSQAPLPASQGQQVTLPEKRTPVPQVPQLSPYKKAVPKNSDTSPAKTADELCPLKERPSQKSLTEDSVTNKKITPKKTVVGNLEKERLRRSQKLRELLKDELRKERKIRKEKLPVISVMDEAERSKMTMRDFIHFIPTNNPMKSSLEETKTSEKSPAESQVTGPVTKPLNDTAEEDVNEDDDNDDSQLLAPRVKVAEDGTIILDEESLTVEVIRNKAPIVEGNDPIFERGSTTTYSSFRRSNYSKPWSNQETDMFFLAISMVGTDFSMIGQLFPHRERIEIKNKFKREERSNGWRIDKAFREKKTFDFEFFADLLEKALEAGKKKPRTPRVRQPSEKKAKKERAKKPKDKSAADGNVDDEEGAMLSEGETAEKENEESLGVKECMPDSEPVPGKKKRTRKKKEKREPEEEENAEAQDGDLPAPKRKKESKKKKKTAVESIDSSPEAESMAKENSPENAKAVKKRARKKKPSVVESEEEDRENSGTDLPKKSKRKKRNAKKSCEVVPVDDAAEGDLSLQSSAVPEEGTSMVLFTEESGCLSGLDELPSIHVCLNEVQELVTPDVSLLEVTIDYNQFETSPAMIHNKDNFLAEDVVPEDPEMEPNEGPMPQGCSLGPVPGLPNINVSSESSEETAENTVCDGKTLEEDTVTGERQTEAFIKSEESLSQIVNTESTIQSAPHVRGRLQRPKPNIQALISTKREKLEVKEDVSVERTKYPSDITQNEQDLSVSSNHDDDNMKVPIIGKKSPKQNLSDSCSNQKYVHEQDSITEDPVKGDIGKEKPSQPARGRLRPKPNLTKAPAKNKPCTAVQQVHHESHSLDSEQGPCTDAKSPSHATLTDHKTEVEEKAKSSTSSQDEYKASPIKPALLARGRPPRPIHNVPQTSAGKADANGDSSEYPAGDICMEMDDHSGQQETEPSASSSPEKDLCSESISPQQEIADNAPENPLMKSLSHVECKKSPIKPAPLTRGRLQRPKPNLLRATGRKEESKVKDDESIDASSVDPTEKTLFSPTEGSSAETVKEFTSLHGSKGKELTDFAQPLNNEPDPKSSVMNESVSDFKKSPITPALLTRGRLQRPKPNLQRATGRKEESKVKEDESNEASSVDPTEITLCKTEDSSIDGSTAETLKELTSLDESKGKEFADSVQPLKENPEHKCSGLVESVSQNDGKKSPIKPALLTRGRLQRPKPNLLKAGSRKGDAEVKEPRVSSADAAVKISLTNREDLSLLGNKVLSDESCQEESSDSSKSPKDLDPKSNVIPDEVATLEQVKELSVKPVRTRFTKVRPNIGRAAERRTSVIEPVISASEQKEVEVLEEKKGEEEKAISPTSPRSKQTEHTTKEKPTAIKPTQMSHFKPGKAIPNLVNLPDKSASPSRREEASPLSTDKDSAIETHVSSPSNKRKAVKCGEEILKRSRFDAKTHNSSDSSETAVEQVSLSSEIQNISEQSIEQHSRFGRPLRKSLTSTPPVLPKPSENYSERPGKEKPVHSVKPNKGKVSKPVAKKSKGKTTLVKIRATQQEDDDEDDDDAEIDFVEDHSNLAPEMVNLAPVFVPFSMRSPTYVPAEIEETVEELELPMSIEDVASDANQEWEKSPSLTSQHELESQEKEDNEAELMSGNLPAVPIENCTTVEGRTVENHDVLSLQAANGAFLGPDQTQSEIITLPFNQSYVSTHEEVQHGLMSQDVSVTDGLLTDEPTFILTLVEIPINEEYSYSCDSNSADSLPAPVLISSGSSQTLTQPHNQSFGFCGPPASLSHEPGTVVQEHTQIVSSPASRKRNASGSSGAEILPPKKKVQVEESPKECRTNTAASKADSAPCSTPEESSLAVPGFKKTTESPPSSVHIADLSVGEEKMFDCGNIHQPPTTSTESLNQNLSSACANITSSSKTPLKRPGRKPLGFLSLVCKDKQSKNAKEEPSKKKSTSKSKLPPSLVSRPQKHSPVVKQEDAATNEMPSPATISSSAATQTAKTEESISPEYDSANQPPDSQESSKVSDIATEEEAVSVSEYFFSDIFMEIDE